MRLIVTLVDSGAAQRVLETMLGRGLPAVLVWAEGGAFGGGRATLLVGARDGEVVDVCASLGVLATVTEPVGQTLMPLSDPTDLHIGRLPIPGLDETGLFVLRLSRFEQIW